MDGYECEGFFFFSNFDSANLNKVEHVPRNPNATITASTLTGKPEIPDVEFNLWTKHDCGGTIFENGNRTWFYFGVKSPIPSVLVKFNMVDLNKQAKLYSQGMGPVYRMVPAKPHWERVCDKPTFTNDNVFTLSFKFRTPENIQNMIYFAFTYPYTYSELQHKLDVLDKRFKSDELISRDDIYYVRECVCRSLEGRRVDLLTISSLYNITDVRETRLRNLFPDKDVLRPYRFTEKKVIFLSARVHPGETPSSFVLNGLLNLLLTRDDPVAIILRKMYVFKLIPFLNPDGVANGHYRTDTRGVNLNRVYLNPDVSLHPTIYAARALIRYYHYGYEPEDDEMEEENHDDNILTEVSHMTLEDKNKKNVFWCNKCKSNMSNQQEATSSNAVNINENQSNKLYCVNCGDCATVPESGLFLYLDMHGHASKKGIFMYGNHFDDVESNIKCMILPKIMSINNHNFHFTACNFTERNMYLKDKRDGMSREGSGRVAVYKLTGLIQSYTLECNYNTGRLVNVLPPTIKETSKMLQNILVPPKYNPLVFEEVGKAIGISILDLTSQNPATRLPHSEYHSLNGLREWLRLHCTNDCGETRKSPNKLKIRHAASLHAQGKAVRSVIVKTRSLSKYGPKKINLKQLRAPKKKEKDLSPQPSCSYEQSPSGSTSGIKCVKATKSLTMQTKGKRDIYNERPMSVGGINHIARNIQNTNSLVKNKFKTESNVKATKEPKRASEESSTDKIKLKEICYIKDTDGKRVIAKYENDKTCEDDNLIVKWDSINSKPQVFTHKSRMPAFLSSRNLDESQRPFRVHNFHKSNAPFSKAKRNKRVFKRLASTTDTNKIKKKLLKKKSHKDLK